METHPVYRFGPYRLDAAAKVLFRGEQPVHLTRKAVETLIVLASRSPEVATKEEIMAAVWQDRVVDEANLAQNIAVIRKTLAASPGDPAYIETFPGRGYRLLGPVSAERPGQQPAAAPPARPPETAPAPNSAAPRRLWPAVAGVSTLLAAVVLLLALVRRESPEPAPVVAPVTRLAGKEFQPAISPDGSMVAFVWQESEQTLPGIWIQKFGEPAPRQISTPGYSWSSPAWSPDGRQIACLRFGPTTGEIVILPASSGEARVVAPVLPTRFGLSYHHLDWSPDGEWLAVDDTPSLSQPLSIFLVRLATGEKQRLTQPEEMIIGDVAPRFSPEGRTIAFIRAFHRSYQEVFTVPVTGGSPRQWTSDSRMVSGVDWTSDGLLAGSSRGGSFRIWRLAPGKAPAPTAIYGEFPIQFSYCRRAARLVYSLVQNDPNIWRLTLSPAIEWKRIAASSGQDASPQYSPDGRRIAFRSDRSGEEQIWVSGADGSNPVQVTFGSGRPSVPRWSPDGRRLVFNDAATTEMYLAEEEGARWVVRPFGARGVHPVFSPDGQFIYAAAAGSILRYPAGGGQAEIVTPTRGLSLDVSPDGRYVYFVREPADTTLSRVELRTGEVERVLSGLVPYCTSCWALSETGIYYLGVRPKAPAQQSIFFMDWKTRAVRLVADYPEPILPIGIGPFSLAPDRRSMLVVRLDPSNADVLRADGFR
ncbi:MAG: winged helix-turn-helix domain-containing protein [Bryobacteraceae bacterium]|nr:winged helix-turn-helix domain-containing protein [Bryobacteraceae bacterium]